MLIRPLCRQLTSLWFICEDRFSAEHREEDERVQHQTEEQRELANGKLLQALPRPLLLIMLSDQRAAVAVVHLKQKLRRTNPPNFITQLPGGPQGCNTSSLLLSLEGVFSVEEMLHAEALTY